MEGSRTPRQFPLFKSEAQARVLAAIFVGDDPALYLTAIAERAKLPLTTVHREVDRLEQSGLVMSMRAGRNRIVGPNPGSPYVEDVRRIVLKTYGPPAVVADELETVARVHEAYLFGSWAARAAGTAGPTAGDIDVLVIGSPAVGNVYDAARRAEDRLGLEVNPIVVSHEEWEEPTSEFLRNVKTGPLVRLR